MQSTAPFAPVTEAKLLIRRSNFGSLATLSADGGPHCSLVNVATMPDGAPVFLISRLALHTRNILADPRVSLLLSEHGSDDPLEGTRLSLSGSASIIADGDEMELARRRYLARHSSAQAFAGFKDFGFYKLVVESAHLVAGFGRIVSLAGPDLMTAVGDAGEVLAGEASAVEHMNDDHSDANRLYATRLLGGSDGNWVMTGLDPEGADLALGRATLRLSFPERVTTGLHLRKTLVALVGKARAKP